MINQRAIEKLVEIEEVISDYYRRLGGHLRNIDPGRIPCIYIAGRTCQKSFDKATSSGLINKIEWLSESCCISLCMIAEQKCIVLEGLPHPLAHLMARNSGNSRNTFKETMMLINAMGRCSHDAMVLGYEIVTPDYMEKCLQKELQVSKEQLKKRREGQIQLTQLLFNNSSGYFPDGFVKLQNMDVCDKVLELLMKWKKYGNKDSDMVLAILQCSHIYLDPLSFA